MHKIEIAQQAIDISMRRRGRVQPFVTIEPRKTALLVVDMQTGFLEPGAVAETPAAREIVPNINRLANALRRAGGTVVWIVSTQESVALCSTSFREALASYLPAGVRRRCFDGRSDFDDRAGKRILIAPVRAVAPAGAKFTTRPEIIGTFGAVSSTHWLASAVGMSILERGGNAFDAAVATGFTL